MDPIPPPQDNQPRSPVGILLTLVLFAVSFVTNCVKWERQADELRRQGKEIAEIKAMVEQQQKRP